MSQNPAEQQRRASESALCAALQEVADILKASDTCFSRPDVTVMTEDKGDLDTLITAALERIGLCATVMLRKAGNVPKNVSSPVFRDLALVVEVCEQAEFNRGKGGTGITALEAAEKAATVLHHATLTSGRKLFVTDLEKYPQPPPPADNCYHLILSTSATAFQA